MITHRDSRPLRVLARLSALGVGGAALLAGGTAYADAPRNWEDVPSVSGLHVVTVLFLIPLGLFLVISLLTVLPSLIKGGGSYHAGQAWLSEGEWFGGPYGGLEHGAEPARLTSGREHNDVTGGAGARF